MDQRQIEEMHTIEVGVICLSCKADIIEKDNLSLFPLRGLSFGVQFDHKIFNPLCEECQTKAQQAAIDYLESDKS